MPAFEEKDAYKPYRVKNPLDKNKLPMPIFEDEPKFVDLYYKAWELAHEHVLHREDSPQKDYIDEAMKTDTIWIWDTCFMALYCRYAPDQFPGIESLNNFYYIMHDRIENAPFKVHHPDNPPLFAWIEWEYFKLTGDEERLKWVVKEKQYLQKHYEFIENAHRMKFLKYAGVPLFASKEDKGFRWSGVSSGMDNTPRGRRRGHKRILWLDLAAQQALSALKIIEIAKHLGETGIQKKYTREYEKYKKLINAYYWDEDDGIYYDIKRRKPNKKVKVKTPATYWPLLAGLCDEEKANMLKHHVEDPNSMGGKIPFTTVARNDADFDPLGQYWRGGVWMPTSYMGIKALEKSGFSRLANELSMKTNMFMLKTFENFEPHTIWEAYAPIEFKPSTYKKNARLVRPDFCGWSALGPISLFIENILGFRDVNAFKKTLTWDLHQDCKHGINNFKFGKIKTDICYDKNQVKINSNSDYDIIINDKIFNVERGENSFNLNIGKKIKN